MPRKIRLWTPGFAVLWQGQLISSLGDAVYGIALGFWVLNLTGSSALMGALMASSTLPGVLVAPFAGVIIDRADKKRLLIFMDLVRAAAVILLAIAAYGGLVRLWMVFAAGIILSLCGAVFSPCVQTVIPSLAPPSRILQADSAFSAAYTGAELLGKTAGGFLYQLLGAPVLFLINGLSFLFSCLSLPFVKVPVCRHNTSLRFFQDMADGFRYLRRQAGLGVVILVTALSNFFLVLATTLFIPLCEFTPGLGSVRYGVLMACLAGGTLIGYALLAAVPVRPKARVRALATASFLNDALIIVLVNQPYFAVMAVLLALAGAMSAVVGVLLVSAVQRQAPEEVRGKVMSFAAMAEGGLAPVAMAAAGVLGQALPVRTALSWAFILSLTSTIPVYFHKRFRACVAGDCFEAPAEGAAGDSA